MKDPRINSLSRLWRLPLWWALMLLLALSPARAVELEGLYEARVAVKGQERAERLRHYPEAIAEVIVRLSGDTSAPAHPRLAPLVRDAARLVQQFHYEPLDDVADPLLREQGYTHELVVQFDGEALTRALMEAGVPLWGRTRPETLVWLAVEDRGGRYVLAAGASEELESALRGAARRRGLPLLLPLMDLEDRQTIRFADLWGGFRRAIEEASRRYGPDAILLGRLYRPLEGPWQARWSLFVEGDAIHWQSQAWDQGEAIAAGIEGAADQLAARYAQLFTSHASDRIELEVEGIDSLEAYARALAYLQSLDAVAEARPVVVHGERVRFDLAIRTNRHSLVRDIALGRVLSAAGDGAGGGGMPRLLYRLNP